MSFFQLRSPRIKNPLAYPPSGGGGPTNYTQNLTAALSFTGSFVKRTSRSLTGVLSFIGTFVASHLAIVALTGALSFTGALTKRTSRTLTGGLSFTGSLLKAIRHVLTGALSFTGSLVKRTSRALTGGLSFVGALTPSHLFTVALTAYLYFTSGRINYIPNPSFEVDASFWSLDADFTRDAAAAMFGSSGIKQVSTSGFANFTTVNDGSGIDVSPGIPYTLTFYANITISSGLAPNLKVMDNANPYSGTALVDTSLFPADGAWHQYSQTFTVPATTTKISIRFFNNNGSNTTLYDGFMLERGSATGTYFDGATGGAWTGTAHGSTSYTGGLAKRTGKALTAGLSFTGSIRRFVSHLLTGGLSFTGSLAKRTSRILTGGLSFTGAFTKRAGKALTAALSFTGAFSRRIGKAMTAALSFTGSINRRVSRALTGGLSFVGTLVKRTSHILSGGLSFVGSLAASMHTTLMQVSLTGALSFTGAMTKRTSHTMTAALSFVGSILAAVPSVFTNLFVIITSRNQTQSVDSPADVANVESTATIKTVDTPTSSTDVNTTDGEITINTTNTQT